MVALFLLLAWSAAGVSHVMETGNKPDNLNMIFLYGPVFWCIYTFKWCKKNKHLFKP